jgi:hypothetical protein
MDHLLSRNNPPHLRHAMRRVENRIGEGLRIARVVPAFE